VNKAGVAISICLKVLVTFSQMQHKIEVMAEVMIVLFFGTCKLLE
jgi:hypothetical protein